MTRDELLTPSLKLLIRQHALDEYPNEACGIINSKGEYLQFKNVSPSPEKAAQFRRGILAKRLLNKSIRAVVHSHPNGPNCPSEADMISQIHTGIPFVIVSCTATACLEPFAWGDQLVPLPLDNRTFQHGVADCYELIRDYYYEVRGKRLKQFPRDWEWWLKGLDLYTEGFAEAGFRVIPAEEATTGDVCFMQIKSPVPNHAGILVEEHMILHHATSRLPFDSTRLSKREPIERWRNYITQWVRYTGDKTTDS